MPPLALTILSGVRNFLLHTVKSHREASPWRPLRKERKGIDFQWEKKKKSQEEEWDHMGGDMGRGRGTRNAGGSLEMNYWSQAAQTNLNGLWVHDAKSRSTWAHSCSCRKWAKHSSCPKSSTAFFHQPNLIPSPSSLSQFMNAPPPPTPSLQSPFHQSLCNSMCPNSTKPS